MKKCPRCKGTGDIDYEYRESCSRCNGTGEVAK